MQCTDIYLAFIHDTSYLTAVLRKGGILMDIQTHCGNVS